MNRAEGKSKIKPHVRWMIRSDEDAVLEVERQCFGPHAWQREDFTGALKRSTCIGLIAERQLTVVGYAVLNYAGPQCDLENLGVLRDAWRQGVGQALVETVVAYAARAGCRRIEVVVRETNTAAACFFQRLGFKALLVPQPYDDCPEDGYRFTLPLQGK